MTDDFTPTITKQEAPTLVRPSVSFGKETVALLLHSKVTVFFSIILLILIIGAVVIPMLWPFDYAAQNVTFANKPLLSKNPVNGFIHIFGTDHLGRDMFVRVWYGARVSLLVAVVVTIIDGIIGVAYGSISGYFGGAIDNVMMRVLEIISGIPYLIVVLLLMAVLPQGIGTLILAYSLVGWTSMARLVRGQVNGLNNQEFIIAARIMGADIKRIIARHLIPNTLGVIIAHMTLDIPAIIFTEAFLSMLGMGVPPPYPSLGILVNEGIRGFQMYPAQLIIPSIVICFIMLSFNLLGDQLQDVLDPKIRRRFHGAKYSKH